MVDDFPTVGQVFQYHFLWKWQAKKLAKPSSRDVSSSVGTITIDSSSSDGGSSCFLSLFFLSETSSVMQCTTI